MLLLCHITVSQLHAQAHLLDLSKRREIQLLGLLFDARNDQRYVRNAVANTRLADRIVFSVERVNYEIYRRNLWNNLNRDVQMSRSKSLFKSRVKALY